MRFITAMILLLIMGGVCAQNTSLAISVGTEKLALPFWSASKNQKGGVVLVQGEKAFDGSAFLRALGARLATQGWSCILLDPSSKTPWLEQLPEAMSNMRQQKAEKLIVVFYDANVSTLLDYFSKPQSKQVNGLILISAYDVPLVQQKSTTDSKQEQPLHTRKLTFPVYDIVAQSDYPAVVSQAKERMQTFKDLPYQQRVIPGAYHDYGYHINEVAAFLSGWMNKLGSISISRLPY